jgi:phospholipid/cholesterol/gamma-HCH transport system ATP-binding protein
MTAAISFRDVSTTGFFDRLSFEVEPGSSTLIVTSGDDEGTILLRLITGISRPSYGSVHVFGQSLDDLTPAQFYPMRQQIGVVPSHGGMISNLKLWENITLPLLYTSGNISGELEEDTVNRLKKMGYSGSIMAMSAHLSLYEKRIAAFLRATILQPRIMIYDHCFEDIAVTSRKALSAASAEFHDASPDRTSLYLMSSTDMARELQVDCVITVHESSEIMADTQ